MILELGLLVGFLALFGLWVAVVGSSVVSGQSSNRTELERVREEFERMIERMGEQEGDSS